MLMKKKKFALFGLILSSILIPTMFKNPEKLKFSVVAKNSSSESSIESLDAVCRNQLEALKSLCSFSGISINENFDGNEALKLVESTQKQFFNRKPKQERWENSPLEWITKNSGAVESFLKTLGFLDSIFPEKTEYDAVCILGAAGGTMKNRIKFLEKLVVDGLKTQKIVLLTGERYLTENIDGSAEELAVVSDYFGIELKKLTETHLFKYLYEKSKLNGNFELIVIDTPQRNGCRPTTQTTLEDFLKWQSNHSDIQNILFISNQPSVKYQEAVISEVLYYYKSGLNFEVVGDGCKSIKAVTPKKRTV